MGLLGGLVGVALFWTAVWAGRKGAEAVWGEDAVAVRLSNAGLTLYPGAVMWETPRFNGLLFLFGGRGVSVWVRRQIKLFYDVGTVAVLVLAVCTTMFLAWNLFHALQDLLLSRSAAVAIETAGSNFRPLVPGVNFPLHKVVHLLVSAAVSLLFHEMGHAWAASVDNVPTRFMGLSLFGFAPGAYVRTDNEVEHLPARGKLRVFTAGVWHNALLCMTCFVVASYVWIPLLPLYKRAPGVAIGSIPASSFLHRHASTGDVITHLNDHRLPVTDLMLPVVQQIAYEKHRFNQEHPHGRVNGSVAGIQKGVCAAVRELGGQGDAAGHRLACCEMLEVQDRGGAALNDNGGNLCVAVSEGQLDCVVAGKLAKVTTSGCASNNDCSNGLTCLLPVLPKFDVLVRIEFHSSQNVMFAGMASEILEAATFTDFIPRQAPDAIASFFGFREAAFCWPTTLRELLSLTLTVSASVGALNTVPVPGLDGQHTIGALFVALMRRDKATLWTARVLRAGAVLLGCNICAGFVQAFR